MWTRSLSSGVGVLLLLSCRASVDLGVDVGEQESEGSSSSLQTLLADAEWVDLTYPFAGETIYWPTAKGFELTVGHAGYTEAGFYYAANDFAAAEHGGTHLDSPIHFWENGDTVDEIPLRRLIGEGVVVDLSEKCADNPDCQITIEDLRAWEKAQGRELSDMLVLLRTGWGRFWPDRERYLGTEERGDEAVAKLHFPGLHPEAARWLAEERSIRAIGLDTASIDYGQSQLFESHVALFEHGIPVFENVAALDTLPEQGFIVVALPMKIAGGSGGPLRIVALLPADSRTR
jgi:kynurenine formamidase